MANYSIAHLATRKSVAAAVRQARIDAAQSPRWITAINRAAVYMESCSWQWNGETLLVSSATDTSLRYTVDASGCDCKAGVKGTPCWHRAARRLLCKAAEMAQDNQRTTTLLRTLAEVQADVDEIFA